MPSWKKSLDAKCNCSARCQQPQDHDPSISLSPGSGGLRYPGCEAAPFDVAAVVDRAGSDDFVDGFAEIGRFVRFGDHAAETKILVATHGGIVGVTAGDNCVHGRIDLD